MDADIQANGSLEKINMSDNAITVLPDNMGALVKLKYVTTVSQAC